jgi:tRNA 2-thiouridine synthesizing protein B
MSDAIQKASPGGELLPTLHLLNKAPSHPRFRNCLEAIGPDDQLLLLENAALALADSTVALPPGTSALAPDCKARGIGDSFSDKVARIDSAGMVELTDRFQRIISW